MIDSVSSKLDASNAWGIVPPREIKRIFPDGTVYEWSYDASGNVLTKMVNGVLMQGNIYDALNRPITRQLPEWDNRESVYEYDAVGNRMKMTAPEGVTAYAYNKLNQLISITDPDGKLTTFEYDSLGRRIKLNYPNGCYATYSYDEKGQLLRIANYNPRDRFISYFAYDYDASGNRISMEEEDRITYYLYDSRQQLIEAKVFVKGFCDRFDGDEWEDKP